VDFDQLGGFTFTYGNLRDFLLNQNLTAAFVGDLSTSGPFSIATNPITTFQRDGQGFHRGRQYYLIGYAQDEWKIRPNFTMNYGLRYEYYSPNREKNNRAILFDAASGQLLDPGSDFYKAVKTNFGPRLAFTWAPARFNNKTVIRIGGGLYYGPGQFLTE
jgi:outer membrane receptor protein involved in Fe transport